jgi:hypothetical protein
MATEHIINTIPVPKPEKVEEPEPEPEDDLATTISKALEENNSVDEFKSFATQYFDLSNEIERLEVAVRERKKKLKFLEGKLAGYMKDYEMDEVNTNKGTLMATTRTQKSGLSAKTLKQKLLEFFKDKEEVATQLFTFLNNRETKEKFVLKRIAATPGIII